MVGGEPELGGWEGRRSSVRQRDEEKERRNEKIRLKWVPLECVARSACM
jgi:hypothetical protein